VPAIIVPVYSAIPIVSYLFYFLPVHTMAFSNALRCRKAWKELDIKLVGRGPEPDNYDVVDKYIPSSSFPKSQK
jgi:hypothetical protein